MRRSVVPEAEELLSCSSSSIKFHPYEVVMANKPVKDGSHSVARAKPHPYTKVESKIGSAFFGDKLNRQFRHAYEEESQVSRRIFKSKAAALRQSYHDIKLHKAEVFVKDTEQDFTSTLPAIKPNLMSTAGLFSGRMSTKTSLRTLQ